MSSPSARTRCELSHLVASYALAALDGAEAKSMAAHVAACPVCQREYHAVSGLTDALSSWHAKELPPPNPLWERLLERISDVPRQPPSAVSAQPMSSMASEWQEPEWKAVAPGITCKLLSTDSDGDRVSMLVRLGPGVSYPPHRHAGVEELYLLEGELWIEDHLLHPGDYNRAEAGTSDRRVYSETGCMCLLITSPSDQLR